MITDEIKVDDSTVTHTVSHVYKSDYSGNRGKDVCLEILGEETDECRNFNANIK